MRAARIRGALEMIPEDRLEKERLRAKARLEKVKGIDGRSVVKPNDPRRKVTMDAPFCKRCQEAGRGDVLMGGDGSKPKEEVKKWLCRVCDYHYSQLLREAKAPGNKPGVKLTDANGRWIKDKRGKLTDRMVPVLEQLIASPSDDLLAQAKELSTEARADALAGRKRMAEPKWARLYLTTTTLESIIGSYGDSSASVGVMAEASRVLAEINANPI